MRTSINNSQEPTSSLRGNNLHYHKLITGVNDFSFYLMRVPKYPNPFLKALRFYSETVGKSNFITDLLSSPSRYSSFYQTNDTGFMYPHVLLENVHKLLAACPLDIPNHNVVLTFGPLGPFALMDITMEIVH